MKEIIKNVVESECPVPCLQTEMELAIFLGTMAEFDIKRILEIGTFYGGTLWYFLKFLKPEVVTCVDLLIGSYDERYQHMLESREKWHGWAAEANAILNDVQGNSHHQDIIDTVSRLHPNNDIDLLHIDGDHSYEGIEADYENYSPMVRPGGFIVVHDVVGLPDVARFWKELTENLPDDRECCTVSEEGGWGIGIISIKSKE